MAIHRIKTGMTVSDSIATSNSNFATLENETKELRERTSSIEGKIPPQTSVENPLADKEFVTSSIANLSSNKVTFNARGDGFPTHKSLVTSAFYYFRGELYTPKNKDYAIVIADETAPSPYTNGQVRYEFDGQYWTYAYGINSGTFTEAQLKAIDSGVTAEKLENIDKTLQSHDQQIKELQTKVDGLSVTELHFATRFNFPNVGVADILYIALDENAVYYWDTTAEVYKCTGRDYKEIMVLSGGNA